MQVSKTFAASVCRERHVQPRPNEVSLSSTKCEERWNRIGTRMSDLKPQWNRCYGISSKKKWSRATTFYFISQSHVAAFLASFSRLSETEKKTSRLYNFLAFLFVPDGSPSFSSKILCNRPYNLWIFSKPHSLRVLIPVSVCNHQTFARRSEDIKSSATNKRKTWLDNDDEVQIDKEKESLPRNEMKLWQPFELLVISGRNWLRKSTLGRASDNILKSFEVNGKF